MDALTLLLERRSTGSLEAPGPEGEALEAILQAALRVPDFQALRPYEFILARGEGLERLGAMFADAALAEGRPEREVRRAPSMPSRAPLVVTVVAKPRPHDLVHPLEQTITAGCTVMAMQMAAVAQGYGGIWRSGWPMFNRALHEALSLAPEDQIVGFLYLGTPRKALEPLAPVKTEPFVRWL